MSFHLTCIHEFGKYTKGQRITDPDEVRMLMKDRDHHFVRTNAPKEVKEEIVAPTSAPPDPSTLL
ncbi:hypothetical protein [Bradyrhizobium sp. Tv2a-2]|uniref:hypothetical protein n=1 Tax=Bradyrhizobium sp. Tv2a-2 TaxID=113395 RepID=UPI00042396AE|nr:hypothetical protein [Bradyrhizobium sp. Tv2a-2]